VLCLCAIAFALVAHPPERLAAQGGSPPKCDKPEFRQFDFWVGDWDVTVGGDQAGTNQVTLEEDGCVIHEHWKGVRGETGQSFNYYDRADGKWHQMWVSNSGNVLSLTGTFENGTLTMSGARDVAGGRHLVHRLSFHANPDRTVRQLWETSADAGKTWTVAFDGLYRRKKG
jgi:hypothetical protein